MIKRGIWCKASWNFMSRIIRPACTGLSRRLRTGISQWNRWWCLDLMRLSTTEILTREFLPKNSAARSITKRMFHNSIETICWLWNSQASAKMESTLGIPKTPETGRETQLHSTGRGSESHSRLQETFKRLSTSKTPKSQMAKAGPSFVWSKTSMSTGKSLTASLLKIPKNHSPILIPTREGIILKKIRGLQI